MNLEAEIEFKVDFNDCDPMKIVWHGNYINYFERARCALLDKIGYGYDEMENSGFAFPVAEVQIKYLKPLRFGDVCRAKAVLVEYKNMIKMNFELFNAKIGVLATKGSVSQMCVKLDSGEAQFFCPKIFTEKVENLLKEV